MRTTADEKLVNANALLEQCQEELYGIVVGQCQGVEDYGSEYLQEIGEVFCALIDLRRKLDPNA